MSNKGPYGDFKLMQLLHKEIGLQRLCCTIKVLVLSQVMSIWLWLQGKRKSSRLNMRHDRSIHKVSNFNAYSGFSDDAAGSLWRNSNIQSTASKLDAENFPGTHQCFCFTCRHLFLRRILFLLFFFYLGDWGTFMCVPAQDQSYLHKMNLNCRFFSHSAHPELIIKHILPPKRYT